MPPEEKQKTVRRTGILIAIVLRVLLLFVVIKLVDTFREPFFTLDWPGVLTGAFNFSTLVFLLGGGFIMYTAVKEIGHMLSIEELAHPGSTKRETKTASQVIFMIVVMNLVFSFDSILSALAITKVFAVLAAAIVASGLFMMLASDQVAAFLKRNRKYEVLGLFILLLVGVVLLGEGGHEAHMHVVGYKVEPLAKSTFYFSIAVLVIVDVIQSRYRKKLDAERSRSKSIEPA